MPQALESETLVSIPATSQKAVRILSKSIYRELKQNGYEPSQIVALATELLGQVTSDINADALELSSRLD